MRTLGILLLLAFQPTRPTSSDRALIEAQAKRMDRAFETRQMHVWDEVMASDFRAISPARTYCKAEYLAGGTEEANSARPPVSVNIAHRETVQGLEATGEARERTCYTIKGKDGQTHRLCYRQQFSERWRKEGGVWRLTEIRYSPHRSFRLDGRLITRDEMRTIIGR